MQKILKKAISYILIINQLLAKYVFFYVVFPALISKYTIVAN
ncbi:hypothetical protein BC749_10157 [Flavobacterium araucananum]|jgi:hypothetical protein|nr:hypothetical protein BC749_10157 [Flavobacterium araucananum]